MKADDIAIRCAARVHQMFRLPPCRDDDLSLIGLSQVFQAMRSHLPSPYLYNSVEEYLLSPQVKLVIDGHDRVATGSNVPAEVKNYSHHMLLEFIKEHYNGTQPSI